MQKLLNTFIRHSKCYAEDLQNKNMELNFTTNLFPMVILLHKMSYEHSGKLYK